MSPRGEGSVFAYPYLWADDGGLEHPKNRTTCLAIRRVTTVVDDVAAAHLFLLGISDSPRIDQAAMEIPISEKRRAGLQADRPAYIVISEYNYDVLPHSWHYDPGSPDYGSFSPAFTQKVQRAFLQRIRDRATARSDRTT